MGEQEKVLVLRARDRKHAEFVKRVGGDTSAAATIAAVKAGTEARQGAVTSGAVRHGEAGRGEH